jgi:hypothetical protein
MILLLGWFTVSLPIVNKAQQETVSSPADQDGDPDGDGSQPIENTSEEKAPSGTGTMSEEYIHHGIELTRAWERIQSRYLHSSSREYISFHGEMLCPPPDILIV